MDDAGILPKIREKIAAGTLPSQPALQTWGKVSAGEICAICEEQIDPDGAEILADSADGQQRTYHPVCYNHLMAERRRLAE